MASRKLGEGDVKWRLQMRWGNAENGDPAPSVDVSSVSTLAYAESFIQALMSTVSACMDNPDGDPLGMSAIDNDTPSMFA